MESETERKPEVPASPRDEALFHCAKPSGVPKALPTPQYASPLSGTLGSSLRSPEEVEGKEGFPPHPEKDLESPSTRLQALVLPRLESNDALPITTPMETGLPWCRTRGSLRSSSCLLRKPPRAPQLEETPVTPPSLRAEGLLFLPGLESNPEPSLQTEEEA